MAIEIETSAEHPKRITVGDRTVDEYSLRELIEADRYVEAKKLARKKGGFSSILFQKFESAGPVT